jgi:hypothetical protein
MGGIWSALRKNEAMGSTRLRRIVFCLSISGTDEPSYRSSFDRLVVDRRIEREVASSDRAPVASADVNPIVVRVVGPLAGPTGDVGVVTIPGLPRAASIGARVP